MFNVDIWNYSFFFFHLKYVIQLQQQQHERKTDDNEQNIINRETRLKDLTQCYIKTTLSKDIQLIQLIYLNNDKVMTAPTIVIDKIINWCQTCPIGLLTNVRHRHYYQIQGRPVHLANFFFFCVEKNISNDHNNIKYKQPHFN